MAEKNKLIYKRANEKSIYFIRMVVHWDDDGTSATRPDGGYGRPRPGIDGRKRRLLFI